MKLGGFGCLKVILLMPRARSCGGPSSCLTTVNIFYGALIACRKTDLKYITAYSSSPLRAGDLRPLDLTRPLPGRRRADVRPWLMTALFFALIG